MQLRSKRLLNDMMMYRWQGLAERQVALPATRPCLQGSMVVNFHIFGFVSSAIETRIVLNHTIL